MTQLSFQIPLDGKGFTNWLIWKTYPHASVTIEEVHQNGITAEDLKKSLISGIKRSQDRSCHRAFIFFVDSQAAKVEELIESFKSELSYEIFREIILVKEALNAYDYEGLAELVRQTTPSRVEILSLAPSREVRAQQVGLYRQD